MKRLFYLFALIALLSVSCSPADSSDAAGVLEQYIQALANKDKAVITNLSCNEWEESAILEVDALLSVEAVIKDLACEISGEDGEDIFVVCGGSLDLTYKDEIQSIDLSRRTYTLRHIDGQWRVCSYE